MFGTPRVRSSTPQFAQPAPTAATARRTVTPAVPTARPALQRRVAGDSPARPAVFNAPRSGTPTAAMAGGPGTLSLLRVRVAQALAALDACMGPDVSRGEEHLRGEVVRAVQQWLERQPATLRPSALVAEPQPASTVTVRRTHSTTSAPSAVATPHERRLTPAFGEDASASMPSSPLLTAGTWTSQVAAATRALGSLTIQRRVRLDTLGALLASLRRLEPELSRTTMSDTDPFVASAQKLLPLLTFQLQALDAQVTRAVCEVLELLVRCVGPLLRPAALHNAASKLVAAWTAPQQVAAAEPIGRAINVIVAATKDAATLLPLLCEILDAPRNDVSLARLPAAARLGVYLLDDAVSRGEIQRVHAFLAKERMFSRTDFVVPHGVPLSAVRRAAATRWLAAEEDVVLLSAATGEPVDVDIPAVPHPLARTGASQSTSTMLGGSPSRSSSVQPPTASPFRSSTPSLDPRRTAAREDVSVSVPPSMRAHSVERAAGAAARSAAVSLERMWALMACLPQTERAHTALPLLYALFPEETAAKVASAGSRERRALLQALHAEPAFGICITHPVLLPEAFDAPYLLDPSNAHPDGALVPPGPKRRVPAPAQIAGLGFGTSAAGRAQRGLHISAPALSLPPDMRPAHSQSHETRSMAGASRGASVSFAAAPTTSSIGGGECAVAEFALPPRRGSVGITRRSVAPSAQLAPQSASSPLDFAVQR